jgi:molecular chaperone HtpG
MLLHGVIDSPDIPLNVSRSYLQSDRNVKKISSYITKKVAEKLLEIYKNQKEEYESKWKDISTFVKYGMISDESFAEKAMKFALVQNIDNQSFIFEDYKEKVKANQTDKHNKVVILYTNNVVAQDGLIAACKQKGYDVVEMSEAIDNHFMQHLEYKMGDVVFVRIDSETINNLIQKDEKVESVLSEKEQEQVKTIFEGIAVESKGATVQLQAMGVDDSPVVITKPEFMRRMKEMQQLQGMNFGDFPDMYQVVVNTNHPLVANKLLTVKEEAAQKELATYLYQLAQLNHGMLKGSELSAFVANSLKFLH